MFRPRVQPAQCQGRMFFPHSIMFGLFFQTIPGGGNRVSSHPSPAKAPSSRPLREGPAGRSLLLVFSTGQKANPGVESRFFLVFEGFCESFSPFPPGFPRRTQKNCGFSHLVFHIFHRVFHRPGKTPVIHEVIRRGFFRRNLGLLLVFLPFFQNPVRVFLCFFPGERSHSPKRNLPARSFPHRVSLSMGESGGQFSTAL